MFVANYQLLQAFIVYTCRTLPKNFSSWKAICEKLGSFSPQIVSNIQHVHSDRNTHHAHPHTCTHPRMAHTGACMHPHTYTCTNTPTRTLYHMHTIPQAHTHTYASTHTMHTQMHIHANTHRHIYRLPRQFLIKTFKNTLTLSYLKCKSFMIT